jgi:hypothetical protein
VKILCGKHFSSTQFVIGAHEAQQKRKFDLEIFLKSRFFYVPAFEIYGGTQSLVCGACLLIFVKV